MIKEAFEEKNVGSLWMLTKSMKQTEQARQREKRKEDGVVDSERATRYHRKRCVGRNAEPFIGKECLDGMEEVVSGRRAGDSGDLDGVVGQKSFDSIGRTGDHGAFARTSRLWCARSDGSKKAWGLCERNFGCVGFWSVEGVAYAQASVGEAQRSPSRCDGEDSERCV